MSYTRLDEIMRGIAVHGVVTMTDAAWLVGMVKGQRARIYEMENWLLTNMGTDNLALASGEAERQRRASGLFRFVNEDNAR